MAAMYSELICVGADGKLYQWKWEDPLPYREQDVIYHPRVKALGLMDEKVVSVSASSIRASVLTESGKVRLINVQIRKNSVLQSLLFYSTSRCSFDGNSAMLRSNVLILIASLLDVTCNINLIQIS